MPRSVVLVGLMFLALLVTTLAAAEPWPKPIDGHQPITAGEHPRLFFRKVDLPALRARAETPPR